jgi:hypothetical protein
MRCCARWKILEIVMAHDQSRMLGAHPHSRHPRVAIRVGKINIPGDDNVVIIGASRGQNERAQQDDFE